ncbi:MAG: GNAT family N-acetyltransferase [Pseudomonadota bacterium]
MKIELIENPSEAEVAVIYEGLRAFNIPHFPGLIEQSFGLFIRNHKGQIIGGSIGVILLSVMQIKYLWLAEKVRGQGMGTKLIQLLENEARVRGLQSIALETYTFQAPAFYARLGFNEVGKYVNYPCKGIDKIFYQKVLCNE